MSPSTVTALNVSTTPREISACSAGAAIGASVNTKASIVAMSGAIMPAPLAMPLMVTVAGPSRAVAVATFGKVSVVMIALAASSQPVGSARATSSSMTPSNLSAAQRLADHAGGGEEHLARAAAHGLGGERRGELGGVAAALAGEGVGVAGIDHERARLAAAELRAAPFDRRRRAFRPGQHAGDRRALVEHREQHVGAALVADAGLGGREPHAGNGRHVGKLLRRKRGNRHCHGETVCWPGEYAARDERPRTADSHHAADKIATGSVARAAAAALATSCGSAGFASSRSIFAPSRSLAIISACALRITKLSI